MVFNPFSDAPAQSDIDYRRQIGQSLLGQAQQPAGYWTQGLANIGNSAIAGFMMGRANKEQSENDARNAELMQSLFPTQGQAATTAVPASPTAPVQAAAPQSAAPAQYDTSPSDMTIDRWAQEIAPRLAAAESGGDPNARNPNSTAAGLFQITAPTQSLLAHKYPSLGIPTSGALTPDQQTRAAYQLWQDDGAQLGGAGIPQTVGNGYLAHFLGAPTAKTVLQADPSTPVASLVPASVVRANPFLANHTVGTLEDWADRKMAVDTSRFTAPQPAMQAEAPAVQVAPPQPAAAQTAPAQYGPSPAQLMTVLSDPTANQQTRALASNLLGNFYQQQQQDRAVDQEQKTWLARQDYQRQQQASDPLRQAQTQLAQAQVAHLSAPSQVPQEIQNLQWRAQQAGLQPGSPGYQSFMANGGRGPLVNVNTGSTTSEFQKKSDDAAAGRLGSIVEQGNSAPAVMGQLQQLSDLSRSIGTGRGAQLQGQLASYAQTLGLNLDPKLPEKQAFSAIVDRMAPQMRPVGSGSSSDTDVRMFLNSLPSLSNTDKGNQIIVNTMQALQGNKVQAADLAARAQRGEMSWQDAESAIRKLPDPYQDFRKIRSNATAAPQEPAQTAARTTASGIRWSVN
ncbi:transglycosylase SLT domain-containing protein [Asaia sp. HN010]|uniref:transglycosylase SLT domain-containing protein n=1 Tax=Asaia sp. HN010 TaxID=3081233 RepID=UPI003016EA15